MRPFLRVAAVVFIVACSAADPASSGRDTFPVVDAGTSEDTEAGAPAGAVDGAADDAALDGGAAPDGRCASTFGSDLTAGFGRLDGIVYAVQRPSDKGCAFPNASHVIVQVAIRGAVHRVAVALGSTRPGTDPQMRYRAMPAPLRGGAFAEGWHAPASLDYALDLFFRDGAEGGFAPRSRDEVVAELASKLVVGAKVSIFATSDVGRPDSAHLVHRNATKRDGAIVVDPTGSPTYLLFHFDGQDF